MLGVDGFKRPGKYQGTQICWLWIYNIIDLTQPKMKKYEWKPLVKPACIFFKVIQVHFDQILLHQRSECIEVFRIVWHTWNFFSFQIKKYFLHFFYRFHDCLSIKGAVHKLRWQDFGFFWPPTHLRLHFLPYKRWRKIDILGLPTHLFLST